MKHFARNIGCLLVALMFVFANGQNLSLFGDIQNYIEPIHKIKSGYPANGLLNSSSNEWCFKPGGISAGNIYRESEGRVNLPSISVSKVVNILGRFQFVNEIHKVDVDAFNSVACTGVVKENHSQRGFYMELLCLLRI